MYGVYQLLITRLLLMGNWMNLFMMDKNIYITLDTSKIIVDDNDTYSTGITGSGTVQLWANRGPNGVVCEIDDTDGENNN